MGRLKEGDRAPKFVLTDQNEGTVRLSDFAGRKLLLYFYPKAGTEGCTAQACSIRDAKPDFSGLGVAVVGVSPDCPADQKAFDEKHHLGFPLACDMDHKVAVDYGAWGEKEMFGDKFMGIVRSSFLIDENGLVLRAWYDITPDETVPEAKKALDELA